MSDTLLSLRINRSYAWRHGLFVLLMAGAAVFCGYDGAVRYPYQQSVYGQYQMHKSAERSDAEWAEKARANGWPENPNQVASMKRSHADIRMQFVLMSIAGLVATLMGLRLARKALVELTLERESGGVVLRGPGGMVMIEDGVKADDSRWDKKGIFSVYSNIGRVTVDDWLYPPEGVKQLRQQLEQAGVVFVEDPGDVVSSESNQDKGESV